MRETFPTVCEAPPPDARPRSRTFLVLLTLLALLAASVAVGRPAEAYWYYEPFPRGVVGTARPPVAMKLFLAPDDRFVGADLWVDGVKVPATWDPESGWVYHVPPAPLKPGLHRVELVVRVEKTRPGYYYDPLRKTFEFSVAETAIEELPLPDAESRHALLYLNARRAAAGLPPLRLEPTLAAAATAHARYVARGPGFDGHMQEPGAAGFTGVHPADRAAYFGYYERTSEVISYRRGAEAAIEEWLSAPYHRLPLIRPDNRLLGYGWASDERTVAVIDCGPDWPLAEAFLPSGSGAADPGGGGADAGDGRADPEDAPPPVSVRVVRWPYPGQTGVPTSWPGLEEPDPFRLYPGVEGPVGYTVSLTFPGADGHLNLSSARLTDPSGNEVACMVFSPAVDEHLTDTVALIPYEPLPPATTFTATFTGTVGGGGTFSESWSFTTGPGLIVRGPTLRWSWKWRGDEVEVEFDGLTLRPGVSAFLGGLPVRELSLHPPDEIAFCLPVGFGGGPAPLTLAASDGSEVTVDLTSSLPAAPTSLGKAWTETESPFAFTDRALRHAGGTVVVPASCLVALGAVEETLPELSRTYWFLEGHMATATLGSPSAYVDGRLVYLPLPVQEIGGRTYVPAELVRAFVAACGRFWDVVGHWAADEVTRLAELGIVSGVGDGSFRPEGPLTRAAFVKMVVLAAGLAPAPGGSGGFTDTSGHWVADQGYIGAAAAAGVVRPPEFPDGRFEPDRSITREEMAVMVVRAMGLEGRAEKAGSASSAGPLVVAGTTFVDAHRWTRTGHVVVAVEEGIIRGYAEPDGTRTFRPDGLATRAEAAVMVTRMLDRLASGAG